MVDSKFTAYLRFHCVFEEKDYIFNKYHRNEAWYTSPTVLEVSQNDKG